MPDPESSDLTFPNATSRHPAVKAFRVLEPYEADPSDWRLKPLTMDVLSDDEGGLFIVAALNIQPDRSVRHCYMDITLPERVNDYAYFVEQDSLRHDYPYNFQGEIIPAIAIDCFGLYERFYSKAQPEIGIGVLKRGLAVSKRKHYIAEDLGYIYRDEERYREAAEMFQIAADEGPSSEFIYGELAQAYGMIGDRAREQQYMALYRSSGSMGIVPRIRRWLGRGR